MSCFKNHLWNRRKVVICGLQIKSLDLKTKSNEKSRSVQEFASFFKDIPDKTKNLYIK